MPEHLARTCWSAVFGFTNRMVARKAAALP